MNRLQKLVKIILVVIMFVSEQAVCQNGPSSTEVETMSNLSSQADQVDRCAVCLEALGEVSEPGMRVVEPFECKHKFHAGCILEWLTSKNAQQKCFICEKPMNSSFVEEFEKKRAEVQDREALQNKINQMFVAAIQQDRIDVVLKMINKIPDLINRIFTGIDLLDFSVRAGDKDKTALHIAVRYKRLGIVELLLENKARVNARTMSGLTPLHEAARLQYYDDDKSQVELKIAELLIDRGAIIDPTDYDGRTPLLTAVAQGNLEIARLLIMNRASLQATDENGDTPLHLAVGSHTSQRYLMIKLLVESGALVDVQNNAGDTPLHIAARNGHYGDACLLVENGARVDARNNDGKTPLDLVPSSGDSRLIKLLSEGLTMRRLKSLVPQVISRKF